jgi:uncharacterized SAM-binding protein YcdF (DUF218 family)
VLILVGAGFLLGAALFLFREPVLFAIGDFLIIKDELQPADLIHVIAGPDHRTDYGIELYKQGLGERIFFTGGWCTDHQLYHGQHARELALEQGVPPEAIASDDSNVTSTYSEAVKLSEYIAQSRFPIRSVIVVSDPHHMRRARWTYRQVLSAEIETQMAPVPFELSPFQRRWWDDWDSKKMVRDEYLKFVYYIARYRYDLGPLTDWLAELDKE